jgi:hypothetical protein
VDDVHVEHGLRAPRAGAGHVAAARPHRHLVVVSAVVALEYQARQRALDQGAQQRVAQSALVGRRAGGARGVGERAAERVRDAARQARAEQGGDREQEQRDQPPQDCRLHARLAALHGQGR